MFRSAVFKLTASYVAIVMALCIVFSVVLYHLAVRELYTGFYNEYTRWFNAYEPFGLRQPGTPVQELALRSQHIMEQLVYLNIAVFVVTSVVCYLLARRTIRPIEAAHEQQKRFTADVSHELRTPLTSIRMESEVSLMDKKAPAKDLRAALSSNLEEVDRMEALINNLLLLSTMEADKLRTKFGQIDIHEVIQSALDTVGKSAAAKGITLQSKLTSRDILGDRTSLTQLIVILLENAVKYSPAGSSVSVAIRKGRSRVIVDIQDQGAGIPPADLPHVFDRFYRADSARSRSAEANKGTQQGFGLGLSIAKLIADLHHGEIVITSTPGSGTKASVILPQGIR
ncbi:MAG TPA: ATP-binding protein [Candidatus Saccharimonadales bacterium]|jgi:signal transduction histidine kinase